MFSSNSDVVVGGASQPSTSLNTLERCPLCTQARFFKGKRGLNVHIGKIHKSQNAPSDSASIPISTPSNTTSDPFWKTLSNLKKSVPVLKRVPRGAKPLVAQHLASCVRQAVRENSQSAWEQLLTFPYKVLHVKKNPATKKTLTAQIKENCNVSAPSFDFDSPSLRITSSRGISHLVETKLGDGDISGAARILFSSDVVAPCSSETLEALKTKHPAPAYDLAFPDPPDPDIHSLTISGREVITAVSSFRSGSAGGLDGLSPQHLKDLICSGAGVAGESLLRELTALVNLMLSGKVNESVIDILYGANLCALRKKDGGIRPIAVGTTYRRMAAKICCKFYGEAVSEKFQPLQLGYGSKGGCEAAVHALSTYLNSGKSEAILKVDIKNAFNSVNRDTLLAETKKELPQIYSFLWQCYRNPSKLLFRDNLLESAVGCQQGDPLGPVIFSLAIHPIIRKLNSKFNVWYLDDGTLGGDVENILADLNFLKNELHSIGLDLNLSKCELFLTDNTDRLLTLSKFNEIAPGIQIIEKSSLRLLGSPIFDTSFPDFIAEQINKFNDVSERLLQINMHSAITIIRFCCFGPKLTYSLRASHLWKHHQLLVQMDQIIRRTLSLILNVALDDRAWAQASLPIRMGGLGIRKISSISLPAFISSVHSTEKLIRNILASTLIDFNVPCFTEAIDAWNLACPNSDLPVIPSSQRRWDEPLCRVVLNNLLTTSATSAECARLLAVGKWESGLWLHALPSSNLGTLFDDTTFRIAASLRLGAPCCSPHRCNCGEAVNSLGHHGLSCSRSAGRFARHANLNDIIRRALVTVGVPAVLEPIGLARDDGKRPDGMSLFPWKMGRPLVWDATCVDTVAPSHLPSSSCCAGAPAAAAENLKRRKYSHLGDNYIFEPFGVETLGPWGPCAHSLFKEISKRLVDASRDPRAGYFFGQRLSIAIQRGNAASILGTLPADSVEDEFFDALL